MKRTNRLIAHHASLIVNSNHNSASEPLQLAKRTPQSPTLSTRRNIPSPKRDTPEPPKRTVQVSSSTDLRTSKRRAVETEGPSSHAVESSSRLKQARPLFVSQTINKPYRTKILIK
jgi:hypothetical protein